METANFSFGRISILFALVVFTMSPFLSRVSAQNSSVREKPNIILIVADDLGYGDISSYGATKISTPNIDALSKEGVKFKNAYAASSMCSPSRYSILTGEYSWRSRLKYGVLKWFDTPLIEQEKSTMGEMLQRNGYATACVGKWHLGMDWTVNDKAPENPEKTVFDSWDVNAYKYIDYSVPVKNGPLDRGFDYFYGITGSNNMQPYVYIENDRVVQPPTVKEKAYDHYQPADKALNWDIRNVNIDLTNKAVEVINKHFKNESEKPLFLYHPSTAPHRPCLPTFTKGESQAGLRGDVIQELDWSVSEIIRALKENNAYDNTIIIFTSDNGPRAGDPVYWLNKYKEGDADYQETYPKLSENYEPELKKEDGNMIWKEGWITYDHAASGELLGFKSDAWDGGFKVPLLVSWPARIKNSSENSNMLCLTDLYATIAEIIGETPSEDEGGDSYSFLSNIEDANAKQVRKSMILSGGASGVFVALKDNWKYIEPSEKGRWPQTFYADGPSIYDYQLYNLREDAGEQNNLFSGKQELVKELRSEIEKVQGNMKVEAQ